MRTEREDLGLILTAIIVVLGGWLVVFGWRPELLASGHDAVMFLIPPLKDLIEHGGHWKDVLYRAEIQGGAIVHDSYASIALPVFQLAGLLGLSPITAANLGVFFAQVLYGFFGARSVFDLASLWKHKPGKSAWLGTIALFSFLPVIGWRLTHGHVNLVYGFIAFPALVALLMASATGRVSVTLAIATLLAFTHALQNNGQQLIVYSAIFGLPFALVLLAIIARSPHPAQQQKRTFALVASPMILSIVLSAPKLFAMIRHIGSTDAVRTLGSESITYSYTTATLRDWLSSIPWGVELISSGRAGYLFHEVNYAFGPLLLLLAFVPWRKEKHARSLGIALVVSFVLVLAFSMHWPLFGDGLSAILPPLRSFRVPARAMIPLVWMMSLLAAVGIFVAWPQSAATEKKTRLFAWSSAAATAVALLFVPTTVREIASWLIATGLVTFFYARRPLATKYISSGLVLLVFGFTAISAFGERVIKPYYSGEGLLESSVHFRRLALQNVPEVQSPFERVAVQIDPGSYGMNSAYAAGLSSLRSYWIPLRRFNDLVYALEGHQPSALRMLFDGVPGTPDFLVLQQLYNIEIGLNNTGNQYQIGKFAGVRTAGQAWFSRSIQRVRDFSELAQQLKSAIAAQQSGTHPFHEIAYIVQSDAKTETVPQTIDPTCITATVQVVHAAAGEQSWTFETTSPTTCLLTISMNYSELLHLNDLPSGQIVPTYGALTGVLVPAGQHRFSIEARE